MASSKPKTIELETSIVDVGVVDAVSNKSKNWDKSFPVSFEEFIGPNEEIVTLKTAYLTSEYEKDIILQTDKPYDEGLLLRTTSILSHDEKTNKWVCLWQKEQEGMSFSRISYVKIVSVFPPLQQIF